MSDEKGKKVAYQITILGESRFTRDMLHQLIETALLQFPVLEVYTLTTEEVK